MINWRGDLGRIIGSAVVGIVAFLSWFYESGLLGTLVGIVIGAGIAYFVQKKTQERVWKREYALRNTETVYGPLFQDIERILPYHIGKSAPQGVSFHKWDAIKWSYQYLMIDDEFRNRLDRFSEKTENYTKRLQNARLFAHSVAVDETRVAFPSYKEVFPEFNIKPANGQIQHIHISESLIEGEHPYKLTLKRKKQNEKHEYFVTLCPIKSGKRSMLKYEGNVKRIFDSMWDKCHQIMEQNSDIQTIRKEYTEIVGELQSIRKELIKRIKEPWKV